VGGRDHNLNQQQTGATKPWELLVVNGFSKGAFENI